MRPRPISTHAHMASPLAHAHMLSLSSIVTVSPLWSLRMAHLLIDGCPGSSGSPTFLFESLNVIVSLWFFPLSKSPRWEILGATIHPGVQAHTLPGCLKDHINPLAAPRGCHLFPAHGFCLHLGRVHMTVAFFTHASSLERLCQLCHPSQPLCNTLHPTV